MPELGSITLILALACGLLAVPVLLVADRRKDERLRQLGDRALQAVAFLSLLAALLLLILLLQHNFQVEYVASYTSRDLATAYVVSAFWAGQAGSLLFWQTILAASAVLAARLYRNHPLLPLVAAITGMVQVFFLLLLCLVASPFKLLPHIPPDGQGLNPLLQDPGMIIHPPLQYLGYIGYTIPFAFALAALLRLHAGADWLTLTRRWTLVSWLFLTAGMVIGAQWAYIELGWGGYWAWDPVENASLFPWLTATAFTHSLMLFQARDRLKRWTFVLITLTFFLTIFGTFLTRSGVIQSVHAFPESPMGNYFLVFLGLIGIASVFLILTRWQLLAGKPAPAGMWNREGGFLVNNILFTLITFAVVWGTMYPLIAQLTGGEQLAVDPGWFNKVNAPLALVGLLLMGICPHLPWDQSARPAGGRRLLLLALGGVLVAAVVSLGAGRLAMGLTAGCAFFIAAGILAEFINAWLARRRARPAENIAVSPLTLIATRPRTWGGYAVHLGVALLAVGIVAHGLFQQEATLTLTPGQTGEFAGFTFTGGGVQFQELPGKTVANGLVQVGRTGTAGPQWTMSPQQVLYPNAEQPSAEVAVQRCGIDDLYAIFAGYRVDPRVNLQEATFKLYYNPGINLIWYGFYLMVAGVLLAVAVGPVRPAAGEGEK